ncbi:hypothetical protein HDV00_011979, partial [Rhizophlyctis rosea]
LNTLLPPLSSPSSTPSTSRTCLNGLAWQARLLHQPHTHLVAILVLSRTPQCWIRRRSRSTRK